MIQSQGKFTDENKTILTILQTIYKQYYLVNSAKL